jgi:hypothetical protein
MNLKILYFYYTDKIKKPNINDIINEHELYLKYYNNNKNKSSFKPLNTDEILDVYNERKKDYENNLFFTDIYYLIVDLDNKELLNYMVERTQNDKKFKGWINMGTEDYELINDYFVKSGKFDKIFLEIKSKLKNK